MPIKEKLDKDLVNALTSLYIDHTWLADRSDEVIELFDFCKDGSEQELLIQLLKLFEFITPERYQECLNSICEKITARWGLKESETMLVSLSANEEADSGQLILYDLRTTLSHRHGWLQTKTVNTFGKAQKFAHTRPNVVLVDEFLGTGRSLVGRITEIRKQFNNKGIQTFNIYACIVAGMSFGLEKVKLETGIDPFSVKVCRKGISDLLPDDKRAEGRTLMTAMEDRLAQQYCGVALPRFGDGNGEALRSGSVCLNNFPRFISGLRAGCEW